MKEKELYASSIFLRKSIIHGLFLFLSVSNSFYIKKTRKQMAISFLYSLLALTQPIVANSNM